MPYGVDKKIGGDSPENVSWMEKCVSKVSGTNNRTGKPYTKGEKIAICKAQLAKKKEAGASLSEDFVLDPEILDRAYNLKLQFVNKIVGINKLTYTQAEALYEAELAKKNFDLDRVGE